VAGNSHAHTHNILLYIYIFETISFDNCYSIIIILYVNTIELSCIYIIFQSRRAQSVVVVVVVVVFFVARWSWNSVGTSCQETPTALPPSAPAHHHSRPLRRPTRRRSQSRLLKPSSPTPTLFLGHQESMLYGIVVVVGLPDSSSSFIDCASTAYSHTDSHETKFRSRMLSHTRTQTITAVVVVKLCHHKKNNNMTIMCVCVYTIKAWWVVEGVSFRSERDEPCEWCARISREKYSIFLAVGQLFRRRVLFVFFLLLLFFSYDYCYGLRKMIIIIVRPSESERPKGHGFVTDCHSRIAASTWIEWVHIMKIGTYDYTKSSYCEDY